MYGFYRSIEYSKTGFIKAVSDASAGPGQVSLIFKMVFGRKIQPGCILV